MPKASNTSSSPRSRTNKVHAFEKQLRSSVRKVVREVDGGSIGDDEVLRRVSVHMGCSAHDLIPYEVVIARFLSQEGYD